MYTYECLSGKNVSVVVQMSVRCNVYSVGFIDSIVLSLISTYLGIADLVMVLFCTN